MEITCPKCSISIDVTEQMSKQLNQELETEKMLYHGHWELINYQTGEVTESGDTEVRAVDDNDARIQIENIAEEEVSDFDSDIEYISVWESIQ